jgi:hypothetical protein
MKMVTILGIVLILAAFSAPGTAQSDAQHMEDEVAQGREMVQAGRKDVIRTSLPLTEDEAAAFWPEIMDRYTAMVMEFVRRNDSGDISDEYASSLLENFFAIKQELLDVQRNYVPKFKAAVPALKVAQFFQLENKINAEIDAQLAIAIPLIDPT